MGKSAVWHFAHWIPDRGSPDQSWFNSDGEVHCKSSLLALSFHDLEVHRTFRFQKPTGHKDWLTCGKVTEDIDQTCLLKTLDSSLRGNMASRGNGRLIGHKPKPRAVGHIWLPLKFVPYLAFIITPSWNSYTPFLSPNWSFFFFSSKQV